MDYKLESLGTRQFEHLIQALATKVLGGRVSVFGDGADGGREATWEGATSSLGSLTSWNGYGVLQVKMRQHPLGVADNLAWLESQVKGELREWANHSIRRKRQPDYFVLATNVRISAGPGGGKDSIKSTIVAEIAANGLPIRDFRVWDYDDIKALLDDAPGIRRTYSALLTPGDVVGELLDQIEQRNTDLAYALRQHAARSFREETQLNLTQAGSVRDQQVTVADVFVDLPFENASVDPEYDQSTEPDLVGLGSANRPPEHVVSHLVSRFDSVALEGSVEAKKLERLRRLVLIGGPGQGKSTITQFLAQLYRAEFLSGTGVAREAELKAELETLENKRAELGIAAPKARRWPIRILLSDLADSLARSESISVLDYIAKAISLRSSVPIEASHMRRWLGAYPWLVLVDGLDEVPNTSNRREVMKAVDEFSLEIAAASADVAVVATTRPQGYSEEFSPTVYSHLTLSPLPLDKALEYAKGFIAVRAGLETNKARRIFDRLVRASRDATTARLFASPLQVSILTILIEKLGQVPRDRWRLFSQYYRVISQRELEKGGELSDLLQVYEADVDFIHREIGDLLQRRSAEAGENSATISKPEFLEIISGRLRDQGHSPAKVAELSAEFSRLATDRLVFLAMINSDRVGFEIRSLQEFMAGEYVVNLPEASVIDAIQDRARDPFWRNVVLFAIGCVYAEREHLKASIANLCASLDLEDEVSAALRPGAVLALDVLLDGSCQSQPRYAKPLAERVASLLEGPPHHRIRDLANLTEGEVGELLGNRIRSRSDAPPNVWMNRAIALTALVGIGAAPQEDLNRLFAEAPPKALTSLLRLAADAEDAHLDKAASGHLGRCSPEELINPNSERYSLSILTGGSRAKNQDESPQVLKALRQIYSPTRYGGQIEISLFTDDRDYFNFTLTPVGDNRDAWETLSQVGFGHSGWQLLKSVATFSADPNSMSLAAALGELALASVHDRALARASCWVLSACVEAAEAETQLFGKEAGTSYLVSLGAMAEEGKLGDATAWKAAEQRWNDQASSKGTQTWLEAGDPPEGSQNRAPIWPELATGGCPIFGLDFSMRSLDSREQRDEVIGLVLDVLNTIDEDTPAAVAAARLQIACFVASILSDFEQQDNQVAIGEENVTAESPRWAELVESILRHSMKRTQLYLAWIDWLPSTLTAADLHPPEVIAAIGANPRIRPMLLSEPRDTSYIVLGACDWANGWQQYRLLAHIDIQRFSKLKAEEVDYLNSRQSVSELAECLAAFARLLTADPGQISAGLVDDDLCKLLFAEESIDSIGRDMLSLQDISEDSHRTALWCRSVLLTCDRRPELSLPFISALEKIGSRVPPLVGAAA
ncbi:hypothetical protein HC749_13545 [Arthrobacter sp. S13_S34]|nr:hypothetical protein [Arthrobacter sp. S13_S34]